MNADLERALRSLASLPAQEADPRLYPLGILACAVLSRATAVEVSVGNDGVCRAGFAGRALSRQELEQLQSGAVWALEDPRLRALGSALAQASAMRPRAIELLSVGQGAYELRWRGDKVEIGPSSVTPAGQGLQLSVTGALPDLDEVRERARWAPLTVILSRERINRPLDVGPCLAWRHLEGPVPLAVLAPQDALVAHTMQSNVSALLALTQQPQPFCLVLNGVAHTLDVDLGWPARVTASVSWPATELSYEEPALAALLAHVQDHLAAMAQAVYETFPRLRGDRKAQAVTVIMALARHWVRIGVHNRAEALLAEVTEWQSKGADPEQARQTLASAAELRVAQGRVEEALQHYTRVVESYRQEGDWLSAATFLERILELEEEIAPDRAARTLTGLLELLNRCDRARAAGFIMRALERLDPLDPQSRQGLLLLRSLARDPEIIEQINALLELRDRRVCPGCGGSRIMRDLHAARPQTLEMWDGETFQGRFDVAVLTDICATCGTMICRARHPHKAWEIYQKSKKPGRRPG